MTRRRSIRRGARAAVRATIAACAVSAVGGSALTSIATAAPSVPQRQRVHVTVTLRPRDPAALARATRAVSTPGSPQYRHYLSPHAFAARFGASEATIATVRRALRARGLQPGQASAGGLSIPLSIPAGELPAAQRAMAGSARALVRRALPRTVRPSVQTVIAFGRNSAARPLAVRAPVHHPGPLRAALAAGLGPLAAARARAPLTTTGPQPCPAAASAAAAVHANTDQTIAHAYGFDRLYAAGDEGQGVTVAVYELEPNDPADIAAFQSCYGTQAKVSYVPVDGGAGAGAGSDEAALDIENLIGFAPRSHVLVYQGPNSSSGLPGSGPYDVFSAIVNQDRARVVSVSWGQCEQQIGPLAQAAENVLFEQAAIQGQTIVAAAGDNGAQDCDTGGAGSSTRPAVDDPASQPEVIGVGGTTLLASGPPPSETVWNSGRGGPGAGGGGVSTRWPMPSSQLDTPAFLHVRTAAARGPACGLAGSRYCREVPDVSANADPATGYEIYWNGADSVPEPSGWQALGGTSAAAPLWAALFTLADGAPACAGVPLGSVGPALYRAAAGDYRGNFHDVTSGNNDFAGTTGSRWTAGPGYDLASGLGSPNALPLTNALCADSLAMRAVGGQSSALRAAVSIVLRTRDVRGARLHYSASGLPPGVRLLSRSGRIVGRPRRAGRYRVRVAVRDGRGARAGRIFTWSVGAVPRIRSVRLLGARGARRLQLTVASGPHAPWLRRVRLRLPTGLSSTLRSHPMVRARRGGHVRVGRAVVTVQLRSPSPSIRVLIPVRPAGSHAPSRVLVQVRAGSTGTTVLRAPIFARRGA